MADETPKGLDRKKLGANIRSRRKQMGLTSQELADLIGVDLSTIRFYETGKRVPSVQTAILLAKNLGPSLHDLLN